MGGLLPRMRLGEARPPVAPVLPAISVMGAHFDLGSRLDGAAATPPIETGGRAARSNSRARRPPRPSVSAPGALSSVVRARSMPPKRRQEPTVVLGLAGLSIVGTARS